MKFHRSILLLILFGASVFFSGCAQKARRDKDVVAEIGPDSVIHFTELQKYVDDYLYLRRYPEKSEAYRKALDIMVTDQLKRIDFFKRGLYGRSDLIQSISRPVSEEMIVGYFNREFLGKHTDDAHARRTYENMGKELVYRLIMLKKPRNASQGQIDALRNRAVEIRGEIEKGKDFGELARRYSQDDESAGEGGYRPPLDWKRSLLDPTDYVIFGLHVGDVRVLESDSAFHIVNVTGTNKIDLEPFEEMKADIVKGLENQYMDKSLEEYDAAKNATVDEKSLHWNQDALNTLVRWSNVPNFYKGAYRDTLQKAITNGKNPVVLKYAGGEVDFRETLRLLDNVLIPKSSIHISKKDVQNFLVEAVRTDYVVKKAEALNLKKDLFDPNTDNPVMRGWILRLYNEAVIDPQVPEPTEAALRQFYEENKNTLYYQLAKVNIYALIYSDKTKADEVWTKIRQGASFAQVSHAWDVKTFIRDRNGKIKSYLSDERPFLGEAAFQLEESESHGVVEYTEPRQGRQYAVIQCTNKRPEKQLTYSDVRNSIQEDFYQHHQQRLQQEVAKTLRKKYKVIIHKDVLSRGIASADT